MLGFATRRPSISKFTEAALYAVAVSLLVAKAAAQDAASSTTVAPASTTTPVCIRFQKTGFWDVDIDNGPDLPPDCGPPLSRNADRNLADLPLQIVGIAVSYIGFALVTGIAILIVRLRRRNRGRLLQKSLELEMTSADHKHYQDSNLSPISQRSSFMKGVFGKKGGGPRQSGFSGTTENGLRSPGLASMSSFDASVLEKDRMSRQTDLERLYGLALDEDEVRHSHKPPPRRAPRPEEDDIASQPHASYVDRSYPRSSVASSLPARPSDPRLTRVAQLEIPKSGPIPLSPRSPVRAIYPPGHPMFHGAQALHPPLPEERWPPSPGGITPPSDESPVSPMVSRAPLPNDMYPASPPPGQKKMNLPKQMYPLSPSAASQHFPLSPGPMSPALQRTYLPNDMYPASPPPGQREMTLPDYPVRGPASPRSFAGGRVGLPSRPSSSSSSAATSHKRRTLRGMRVSSREPLAFADGDEDREPLSESYGEDARGRRPPSPPSVETTPDTPVSRNQYNAFGPSAPHQPVPPLPLGSHAVAAEFRSMSPPEELRGPAASRSRPNLTISLSKPSSESSLAPPPTERRPSPAVGSPGNSLPLRNYTASPPAAGGQSSSPAMGSGVLPLRSYASSSSAAAATSDNPLASPAVKTTFLERKPAHGRGPMTARTPMTGVPQTPYTPYMPFTPLTPITPRLVTRKERKEAKKNQGKTLLDESDLVKEVDETWD
jgi:hypothetical protein